MRSPSTRIVVGVDDSDGARRALRWALAEGKRRNADVQVLHAFRFDVAWFDRDDIARWEAMEQRDAEASLAHILDDVAAPPGVEVAAKVVRGPAAQVLIGASETADLLVVGSRGRGGLTGLLFGSVSQRCVERAHCPIVVVPTPRDGSGTERP